MNIQKLIAIAGSIAINCAVLGWFHAATVAPVASAQPSPARVDTIVTLPAIVVHPTRAQMESLRRDAVPASKSSAKAAGAGGMQTLVMPYYSFADPDHDAHAG